MHVARVYNVSISFYLLFEISIQYHMAIEKYDQQYIKINTRNRIEKELFFDDNKK